MAEKPEGMRRGLPGAVGSLARCLGVRQGRFRGWGRPRQGCGGEMGLEGLDSRKMTDRGEGEGRGEPGLEAWRQRTEPPGEKAITLSLSLSLSPTLCLCLSFSLRESCVPNSSQASDRERGCPGHLARVGGRGVQDPLLTEGLGLGNKALQRT